LYNPLKSREIAFAMATTEALNPSQFSLLTNLTADRSSSPNPQQEMDKVIILVNAEAQASGQMSRLSPVTEKMVIALKNAVPKSLAVEVTGTASLWSKMESGKTGQNNLIWCPLTIQLPKKFIKLVGISRKDALGLPIPCTIKPVREILLLGIFGCRSR
jgi:hypothetical protein